MNMDEGVMRQHMQFLDEMHHDPHALWEMIGALPEEMRQQHEVIMHALMDGAHPHHDDHEWDERGFQREAEGFAVKIDMAREVAHRLADMEAMAIFGVWQARERLEPAERIEMLGPMVANEQLRMSVRNAAAWVVMDAQAELDRGSASQDTLRELILTNGAM
jgi:hypothetical protein